MKKLVIKISIIFVIIILLGGLIYYFFSDIRKNKVIANNEKVIQIADNYIIQLEQALKERDKKIETLEKKPKVITKEILVKMPEPEKDELILNLQEENKTLREIVNDDTIIITECKGQIEILKEQLDKSTELLKQDTLNYGFSFYVMPGIRGIKSYILENKPIDFMLIIGLDYIKYFLDNRIGLSAGGWVQPISDIDFGLKLGLVINIKKKKA